MLPFAALTVHTLHSILLSTHLSTHIPLALNSSLHPGQCLQLEFIQFLRLLQLLPSLQLRFGHSRAVSPHRLGTDGEPAFQGVEEESAEGFGIGGSRRSEQVALEEGLGEGGGGEGGEEEEELHGWGVEGDCGGRWGWGEEVTSGDHHDPTHPR